MLYSNLVEIEVGVELGHIEHEVRENFVGRGGQKFSGGVLKNIGMVGQAWIGGGGLGLLLDEWGVFAILP